MLRDGKVCVLSWQLPRARMCWGFSLIFHDNLQYASSLSPRVPLFAYTAAYQASVEFVIGGIIFSSATSDTMPLIPPTMIQLLALIHAPAFQVSIGRNYDSINIIVVVIIMSIVIVVDVAIRHRFLHSVLFKNVALIPGHTRLAGWCVFPSKALLEIETICFALLGANVIEYNIVFVLFPLLTIAFAAGIVLEKREWIILTATTTSDPGGRIG